MTVLERLADAPAQRRGTAAPVRRLHILQLGPEFKRGGIQRHILDLTGHLRAQGHRVTLAGTPGPWGQEGRDAGFHTLDLKAVSDTGGRGPAGRVAAMLAAARRLRRMAIRERFDLVHAHETAPAIVARLGLAGLGIPRLFTCHGAEPGRYGAVARVARMSADIIACPSRTVLEALIGLGLPRERTALLGLGVPPPAPPDAAAAAALRRDLMGGRDGLLIFSPARLAPQKGIDLKIEVMRRVVERRPDTVLALAGHGPLEAEVPGWVAAAGLDDHIRLLGPIDTVPLHMAAADLMLLTSRWEALPISIVEAFHAGLPVIATDCGGVGELVCGDTGRLCPVGDAAALSAAVLELAGDAELRARLGANARVRATEPRFDPDHVHGQIEALYLRMTG